MTQSYALPSKVVSVLGASPLAARPMRVDLDDGGVVFCDYGGVEVVRVKRLMEGLRACIEWLVVEMEGLPTHATANGAVIQVREAIDNLVLRSLVKVVQGCEARVFV